MREGSEFHERCFLFDRVEIGFERWGGGGTRRENDTHASFLNKKFITSLKHPRMRI
jgi:hypothetical protein